MTATKMKQRSFYMDDETYALIERHAEKLGASNGTALRMIVRQVLLDEDAAPVNQRDAPPPGLGNEPVRVVIDRATGHEREEPTATNIILPPDRQETFKVPERFKEKGPRPPKAVHSDDDF